MVVQLTQQLQQRVQYEKDPESTNSIFYPKYQIRLNIKFTIGNVKTFCEKLCSFKSPMRVFFCPVSSSEELTAFHWLRT